MTAPKGLGVILRQTLGGDNSGVAVAEIGAGASGGATMIPVRELWLYQNRTALRMVRDGIEESRRGVSHDLGSFAQYADLKIED